MLCFECSIAFLLSVRQKSRNLGTTFSRVLYMQLAKIRLCTPHFIFSVQHPASIYLAPEAARRGQRWAVRATPPKKQPNNLPHPPHMLVQCKPHFRLHCGYHQNFWARILSVYAHVRGLVKLVPGFLLFLD